MAAPREAVAGRRDSPGMATAAAGTVRSDLIEAIMPTQGEADGKVAAVTIGWSLTGG